MNKMNKDEEGPCVTTSPWITIFGMKCIFTHKVSGTQIK